MSEDASIPHSPTGDASVSAARPAARRAGTDPLMQVRSSDVEPYTGLGYLSKLFRLIAIFLVLLLVLEVGSGLYTQGTAALPTLLSEVSRLIVLAGLLWGTGDLATLLIDIGHDVRAARILLGRQVAQTTADAARGANHDRASAAAGFAGERFPEPDESGQRISAS